MDLTKELMGGLLTPSPYESPEYSDYPKEPVKPSESGKIKVSFNSAGKHGQTSKSVIITCNTKDGKEELKIKANIEVPEGSKK